MKKSLTVLALTPVILLILLSSGCAGEPIASLGEQTVFHSERPIQFNHADYISGFESAPVLNQANSFEGKPRDLTESEIETMNQIAFQTGEVREWIQKQMPYRTAPIWMFSAGTDWNSCSYGIKDQGTWDPSVTFYPGLEIGFGSPQVQHIDVAVDIANRKAIHVSNITDVSRRPLALQPLSDSERHRLLKLAEQAAGVPSSNVSSTEYVWIGLSSDLEYTFEYDAVEIGIPDYAWQKSLKYYPGVRFRLGNPPSYIKKVTIDLLNDKIIQVEGYPVLTQK